MLIFNSAFNLSKSSPYDTIQSLKLGVFGAVCSAAFLRGVSLCFLRFLPALQRLDHLLLHHVDSALLLFKCVVRMLVHLRHELVLLDVQVAVFGLLSKADAIVLAALSTPLQLLLLLLLVFFFAAISVSTIVTLALEHVVDHSLDISRLSLLLDLRPILHDRILEFDSLFVRVEFEPVSFHRLPIIVMEDVIEGERV